MWYNINNQSFCTHFFQITEEILKKKTSWQSQKFLSRGKCLNLNLENKFRLPGSAAQDHISLYAVYGRNG